MIVINVEIPKELKKEVKVLAANLGKTLKQVVADALREKLENEKNRFDRQ